MTEVVDVAPPDGDLLIIDNPEDETGLALIVVLSERSLLSTYRFASASLALVPALAMLFRRFLVAVVVLSVLVAGEEVFSLAAPRLDVRFRPASLSRRRTSRITWDLMALRALVSLILFEARSSSWSMKVKDGTSKGGDDLDDLDDFEANALAARAG